jgi:hypothetical protein
MHHPSHRQEAFRIYSGILSEMNPGVRILTAITIACVHVDSVLAAGFHVSQHLAESLCHSASDLKLPDIFLCIFSIPTVRSAELSVKGSQRDCHEAQRRFTAAVSLASMFRDSVLTGLPRIPFLLGSLASSRPPVPTRQISPESYRRWGLHVDPPGDSVVLSPDENSSSIRAIERFAGHVRTSGGKIAQGHGSTRISHAPVTCSRL